MAEQQALTQLAVNTIRTLSIDAVEKANSGHPGMPMGAAPMGYALFARLMKHNPSNPNWWNRDRFVLSAGHGSMLLYSALHLSGYDLPMEQIQQFRQWGSKTPGHPEFGHTPGVDATTGPLGQGIAMAVGMAMAEAHLGARFNRDGFDVMNHFTYVVCGDGDLMEGVASEAASLAGHLKLGKLIVLYDSNDISLDGKLNMSFSENVCQRFEAYGWQTIVVPDGNDVEAIEAAVKAAQAVSDKPTLIEVKTVIGFGSPNKGGKGGHEGPHGSPLGKDETVLTKQSYGWPVDQPFLVPDEVVAHFAEVKRAGEAAEAAYQQLLAAYQSAHPELATAFGQVMNGQLPAGWDEALPAFPADGKSMSTRVASGTVLNALASTIGNLVGGSADLASSNNTMLKGLGDFLPGNYAARNFWFGVREFAMAAALNGMSLHGGLKVFGGTFFVFSDYLRPAVRLSSLMHQPVIYVLTHDSIAVGEDGPTHEPIEQLPAMRVIPGITVMRPADANETREAYRWALSEANGPVAMVLTRQNLPILAEAEAHAPEGVAKGAYVLAEASNNLPELILLATGSEVALALKSKEELETRGIPTRVVSMPSWELFEKQDESYRQSVIPSSVKARVSIEMAFPMGWERYVGDHGKVIGIRTFGASAPGDRVIKEYGFTVENVVNTALSLRTAALMD